MIHASPRALLRLRRLARRGASVLAVALVALAPTAADAFTYGNIVVTHGNDVVEYGRDGLAVGSTPVPFPPGTRGPFDPLGGLAFDADARLVVFNGAAQPSLSVHDWVAGTWTHTTVPGWTTFDTAGLAGLATSGRQAYVTDFGTLGGPERGAIRLDGDAAWSPTRFDELFDLADVAVGPDGRIHLLLAYSSVVSVVDPVTLQEVASVTLDGSVQAIAVAADGTYIGVSGDGYVRRFDAQGVFIGSLDTAVPGLTDVAIGPGGDLAMGTALGEVVFADGALTAATTFLIGNGPSYVAWVPFHPSTPATRHTWGRLKDRYRR